HLLGRMVHKHPDRDLPVTTVDDCSRLSWFDIPRAFRVEDEVDEIRTGSGNKTGILQLGDATHFYRRILSSCMITLHAILPHSPGGPPLLPPVPSSAAEPSRDRAGA